MRVFCNSEIATAPEGASQCQPFYVKSMRVITIDGSNWKTSNDFYDAVFAALESPSWHGRNLDALSDSLLGGDINGIEPPFELRISGIGLMSPGARHIVEQLQQLVNEKTDETRKVRITVED